MDKTLSFNKCGEIRVALRNGVKTYEFICVDCNEICTEWEDFIMHIDIQHSDDFWIKTDWITDKDLDVKPFCFYQEGVSSEREPSGRSSLNNTIEPDMETEEDFTGMHDSNEDSVMNSEIINDASESENDQMTKKDEKILNLSIIMCYKKQRILWDPDVASKNDAEKRKEAYEKITSLINRKLGRELNVADVKEQITHLRSVFYAELQKEKSALKKGNKHTMPRLLAKLRFLDGNSTADEKREVGNSCSKRNIGLPLANLSHAEHSEFFNIFEGFPCLWDIYHIGFHTKKVRQEAMDKMVEAVNNKMEMDCTSSELQQMLYDIRFTCAQENKRKLKYESAEKSFKPKCEYYYQLGFLLPNIQPFKCPYCEKVFTAPQPYFVHKNEHDGEKPFKCTTCGNGFMTAANCTVHIRRHTQDYPYSCEICEKKFPSSSELTFHMRCHLGDKPFVCEVCGRSFFAASALEYHMRRHRNIRDFKCSVCSKAFFENSQLNAHMQGHLNIRNKICNICDKAFVHADNLRQHKQIHAEKKKYKCKICERDFAQYAGLSGHMKLHGTTLRSLKNVVTSG